MTGPSSVTVTVPARLHFGFLDLNGGLGRRFGSIGLAISDLRTRIAGLQQRLATAVLQHERFLQALVREELGRHKQELQNYRREASYALARLLDESATGAEGK